MAEAADDSDRRHARVEAAIAAHRESYLRATWAGRDGEALRHEAAVDELLHAPSVDPGSAP